jgi:hypothetical protein
MACGRKNQRQSHSTIDAFIVSRIHKKTRALPGVPTFTFMIPFLPKGNLVARKEGCCAEKASAGKEFHAEIAPTRIQPNHAVLSLCPPGPRKGMRLMVFPRNALAPWPGNA